MTGPTKISLGQQIEAAGEAALRQWMIVGGQSVRRTRPESVERYDHARLVAARQTLERLRDSSAEIRAFVDLPPSKQQEALRAVGAWHD